MYEDRKRSGCSMTGRITSTVPALPLSLDIMCFLQTIHYFYALDHLACNLSPSLQSHSLLRALKYCRWCQLPCGFHTPRAVCCILLAIIDGPALLHHKLETGPILQIPPRAHSWKEGVIYGLCRWTLCKWQGWIYRLNVQQEYPAPGWGISLQGRLQGTCGWCLFFFF